MSLRPAFYASLFVFLLGTVLLPAYPTGLSIVQSLSIFNQYAGDDFDWKTLEKGALQVHWYQGDAAFGQSALETASAGLESIGKFVLPDLAQPVEIFIYATVDDLQGTLAPGSQPWIAGHADPALGVIRVVIEPSPEQGIAMEQRIPHELMHIMLYRRVGAGYSSLPAWLREGMATLAELYPNAEYARVLTEATAANRLIPLQDLCASFPEGTGQAFLAYAEARSFTGFLHGNFGSTGLLTLVSAYADGVDCEHGTEQAFGIPLANLEARWIASVSGRSPFQAGLQNIWPYLALLCVVLIVPLFGVLTTLRKKGTRYESGIQVSK